jgi:hypothetical protein
MKRVAQEEPVFSNGLFRLHPPQHRRPSLHRSNLQPGASFSRHNEGKAFWTKGRGPWQLIHSENFATRSAAMTQERRLKALKSKKTLLDYIAQR